MKNISLILGFFWGLIALIIIAYSAQGGDSSIVGGVLFLIWTAPFWIIWQFYIYDLIVDVFSPESAQIFGYFISIICGFVFWFIFIPFLHRQLANKRCRRD